MQETTQAIICGLTNEKTTAVNEHNTAIAMQSGTLPVFATPSMAALMEYTAADMVEALLPDTQTTVGIAISATHIAASPIGMKISAKAELTAIDGRKLSFHIEAFDETEKIGEATHERFIIDKERFMNKTNAKTTH